MNDILLSHSTDVGKKRRKKRKEKLSGTGSSEVLARNFASAGGLAACVWPCCVLLERAGAVPVWQVVPSLL